MKKRIIKVTSTSGLDTNLAFVLSTEKPISYKYQFRPEEKNKKRKNHKIDK